MLIASEKKKNLEEEDYFVDIFRYLSALFSLKNLQMPNGEAFSAEKIW